MRCELRDQFQILFTIIFVGIIVAGIGVYFKTGQIENNKRGKALGHLNRQGRYRKGRV